MTYSATTPFGSEDALTDPGKADKPKWDLFSVNGVAGWRGIVRTSMLDVDARPDLPDDRYY
jgi:hypothetical protein